MIKQSMPIDTAVVEIAQEAGLTLKEQMIVGLVAHRLIEVLDKAAAFNQKLTICAVASVALSILKEEE